MALDLIASTPLSTAMAALLTRGDTEGRYSSRSEAVMATAVAAANAGWSQDQWRLALDSADQGLAEWAHVQYRDGQRRRQRGLGDAERRLRRTWQRAKDFVRARPAVADAPSVRAELAAVLALADADPSTWAGASGVSDRAVLGALVDVARGAATMTPSASSRQLSEMSGLSAVTAWKALRRLASAGWVRIEEAASGTAAATWRLLRPRTSVEPVEHVIAVLDTVADRPALPAGGSARAHDAFAHPIHGGLGRVAARIFDALGGPGTQALSVTQVAALTGLHPRTIKRHLLTMSQVALVLASTTATGAMAWVRAADGEHMAALLDRTAVDLGSAGTGERRRLRHETARRGYQSWQHDFHARRGWAVQRGLYHSESHSASTTTAVPAASAHLRRGHHPPDRPRPRAA